MIYRINIFIFFLLLSACKEKAAIELDSVRNTPSLYHSTSHLLEVEDLQTIISNAHVKVIDFRKSDEYRKGHIPNALNIWRPDIESESLLYGDIKARQKTVEKTLSNLGIQQNDIIIIYDDRGLCDAARLWWVLKTYNFDRVKLLNGGWSAWQNNEGTITNESPKIEPSDFRFNGNPSYDLYIDKAQLKSVLNTENLVLIDARTADEYSGKRQKSGAKRAGRIPNSRNIDWMLAVDIDSTHKFKSKAELETIYEINEIYKDSLIVTYCHTGVRSAHTAFVLTELLGYTNVKNYDGSWSEWSYFNDLPIEKDSITTIY